MQKSDKREEIINMRKSNQTIKATALALSICATIWAEPDFVKFFQLPISNYTVSFNPENLNHWDKQWHVPLSLDNGKLLFQAKWTENYYNNPFFNSEIITVLENDLSRFPFLEGNPLEALKRLGRDKTTPHSHYGIQVIEVSDFNNADKSIVISLENIPLGRKKPFAMKLYNAKWKDPWDDTEGLHQRSFPNGYVLRNKHSSVDMRTIITQFNWFAIEIQGPSAWGDKNQSDSLILFCRLMSTASCDENTALVSSICQNIAHFTLNSLNQAVSFSSSNSIDEKYGRLRTQLTALYEPKDNISLYRQLCENALAQCRALQEQLDQAIANYRRVASSPAQIPSALDAIKTSINKFQNAYNSYEHNCNEYNQLNSDYEKNEFAFLKNHWESITQWLSNNRTPSPPIRRIEIPRQIEGDCLGRFFYSNFKERRSLIYAFPKNNCYPFPEAVFIHAYNSFMSLSEILAANLLWEETAKGEDLRKICQTYFNVDPLPQDLQNILFDTNPSFHKVRFQIVIQPYLTGQDSDSKGNDYTQLLRPHYAIANGLCPGGKEKHCQALVNARYAMRLFGTSFIDAHHSEAATDSTTNPAGFQGTLPENFLLKNVSTHEGTTIQHNKEKIPSGSWVASPNNCQIANTGNHEKSQSFFSCVIGRCMVYNQPNDWEPENTMIVTLHILLSWSDLHSTENTLRKTDPHHLSVLAQNLHSFWEKSHEKDDPKPENPFAIFYELMHPLRLSQP
jgi:hypothetical protein